MAIHSFNSNERTVLGDFLWRQLDKIFFQVHVFLTGSHGNTVIYVVMSFPLQNRKLVFKPHDGHPRAFYAGSYKRQVSYCLVGKWCVCVGGGG